MVINDYIMSKRFIKDSSNLSFVNPDIYYSNMYNTISSALDLNKFNRKLPELVTCYSTERTCEFVSMKDKQYIIYDRYLGQTFNMLNRIYFNSKDKYDIISYAYKILAENYHFSSQTELSQLCLIAYIENKKQHTSYKSEHNLATRAIYTYFQELFVLLHEVAHWHLLGRDNTGIINIKRDLLTDYYQAMHKLNDPERTNSILSDIDAVLGHARGSFYGYIDLELYKKLDASIEAVHNEFLRAAIELIKTSDDFIEECICDEIAVKFLKPLMFSMYGIDTEECLQIIYLGLQNLELLTFLRSEALENKSVPTYLIELYLRNGYFRNIVPLSLGDFDLKGKQKYHESFVSTNRKFSKIIKDPVLFLLTNAMNDLKQMDLKGKAPIDMTDEEYNELMRKL